MLVENGTHGQTLDLLRGDLFFYFGGMRTVYKGLAMLLRVLSAFYSTSSKAHSLTLDYMFDFTSSQQAQPAPWRPLPKCISRGARACGRAPGTRARMPCR